MNEENKQLELKVEVSKVLYYSDENMTGGFGLKPLSHHKEIFDWIEFRNKWGTFVATGMSPKLIEGKEYEIVIEPSEHKKHGKGFSIVSVKANKPESIEEQQSYIRSMLTEKQAEAILTRYPNHKILDMMKNGDFDYKSVKGLGATNYGNIKDFLIKNMDIQEAIVKLNKLGVKFKAMKKLIEQFGSAALVVQKVEENIYNLCYADGFGFKKVDKYAMARGDERSNPNRIKAAIKYILEDDSSFEGHSWISEDDLMDKMDELLMVESKHIENGIEAAKSNKEFHFQDGKVALAKNYFYEKNIKEKLDFLISQPVKTMVNNSDEKVHTLEEELGVTYTTEQKNAIKLAIENNVFILNGKGGVGKSFTVKAILKALDKYSYCCCALSGKAAKILADHGLESMTIHRMLGVDKGGFKFTHAKRLPYDIIVLDEASMVNSSLFNAILSAIKDNGKLIIVGDSGQLSAIGTASIFYDLLKAQKYPQQELTIVHRQAQKSGILSTANTIRDGHQINGRYNYEHQSLGELKDMYLLPVQDKEEIFDIVIDICKKYKGKDIKEFQIITGLKDKGKLSVAKLNLELQNIFNKGDKPSLKRGLYEYKVGDKIIQNGNNYEAGSKGDLSVFNGTLGIIKDIQMDNSEKKKHKVMIQFDGIDEIIEYKMSDLDKTELAYAITCHRSQGSTIQHVLFAFDYGSYTLLSREFVYTGITRSSKACVMVCENAALHHAIRTSHSDKRRTFLYDMLMEEVTVD
ncbi:AAA family ATPase [Bacillus infantis]|uniref:AAA family ATPase n=1 Tax=Bacillus infantis TaxID=324767 RepID=UPI003CEC9953